MLLEDWDSNGITICSAFSVLEVSDLSCVRLVKNVVQSLWMDHFRENKNGKKVVDF